MRERLVRPVGRRFSTFDEWNRSDLEEFFAMSPAERCAAAARIREEKYGPRDRYPPANRTEVVIRPARG